MSTLAQLVGLLLGLLHDHGARHALHGQPDAGHAWITTRHYVIAACRLPRAFHGTFRCIGWITRP